MIIVEIVGEETGLSFNKLIRFSDDCGVQFKSRFCVAGLCQIPEKVLEVGSIILNLMKGSLIVILLVVLRN